MLHYETMEFLALIVRVFEKSQIPSEGEEIYSPIGRIDIFL
jgi:hypothetical protein